MTSEDLAKANDDAAAAELLQNGDVGTHTGKRKRSAVIAKASKVRTGCCTCVASAPHLHSAATKSSCIVCCHTCDTSQKISCTALPSAEFFHTCFSSCGTQLK